MAGNFILRNQVYVVLTGELKTSDRNHGFVLCGKIITIFVFTSVSCLVVGCLMILIKKLVAYRQS